MSQFISCCRLLLAYFVLSATALMADALIAEKEFDCVIIPSKVADLGSNTSGVIKQINVDRNDLVKQEDVIAVLANAVEQATVELANKQASLSAEVEMYKIKVSYAKRESKRAEKAYRKKALSLHALDKTKVDLQLAKMQLEQVKEKLAIADKELIRAKAKLEQKTIRAPFSGVITEQFKMAGEFMRDEAVVRLAQLDPLHVEVIVPVLYEGEIQAGMQAKVCSDAQNGMSWNATVSQVDKVMDARSGTYGVRLTLPNPDYRITAGIRCGLKFVKRDTPQKLNDNTSTPQRVTYRHE